MELFTGAVISGITVGILYGLLGFPIVLLSLGATRRLTIRPKQPKARAIHVDLEGGSLLEMSYATQLHYTHGVPKTREPVGERISLAFRVRPGGRSGSVYR